LESFQGFVNDAGSQPASRIPGLSLLRLDSAAGLAVGTCVLLLAGFLSEWFQLPVNLLRITGAVNIAYGLYSGRLAIRAWRGLPPSRLSLKVLVVGNALWVPVCFTLALVTWPYASWLGSAHLIGEGIFVGVLAIVEANTFLRQGTRT
jgi:hypothetical protein